MPFGVVCPCVGPVCLFRFGPVLLALGAFTGGIDGAASVDATDPHVVLLLCTYRTVFVRWS